MPDFLIVGAGLSGQLLARSLAKRGKTVCLAHDPEQKGASSVAAWMVNPITGIRFVPSWKIENFLPAAVALFRELEQESGLAIWHPQLIHRLFQGADEIPRWKKKKMQPLVQKYLKSEFPGDPEIAGVIHSLGGLVIQDGGWADLKPWLDLALRNPPQGVEVIARRIDRSQLDEKRFRKVIFCTGYDALPLPWKPAKGELLTVKIPGLDLHEILLRGIFVIPLGNDLYRVGATYEWTDLSPVATESGVDFLKKKLAALIALPFEIVDSQAALRPILQDARPVVGMEHEDPRFGVCNGFGSKAALMAPWVVEHFADHLMTGGALDPEISLARLRK